MTWIIMSDDTYLKKSGDVFLRLAHKALQYPKLLETVSITFEKMLTGQILLDNFERIIYFMCISIITPGPHIMQFLGLGKSCIR